MIQKADVLIEALPYIQRFRGETVVVKFGGSVMEDRARVETILKDVAFMACVGLCPVLVHGGGKAISQRMKELNLRPQFVQGLRVTDEAAMDVVEQVLNQVINPGLVQALEAQGCRARGIHGEDIFQAAKHVKTDSETGAVFDWGYVGRTTSADDAPVRAFLQAGLVPVVTPLGRGPDGHLYNINADEAATALARALQARKIVFLSDVPGVLERRDQPDSVISTLRLGEVEDLIRRGVIDGGMIPKIEGAVDAIRAGVRKAHIIDAALPHSLLLELFTDKGVGTEIIS